MSSFFTVTILSDRPFLPRLFFFNDTATTEIYTLSLHDALPIYPDPARLLVRRRRRLRDRARSRTRAQGVRDRKSTRLNSSHMSISYAVFCLKKKKKKKITFCHDKKKKNKKKKI